jgi:Tol biopolymer transport system component
MATTVGTGVPAENTSTPPTPAATRIVHVGVRPVEVGAPIELADLTGRILFDDFEDLSAMDVDGSNVVTVAGDPAGAEFDGAWSPDGERVVYRDSTRGINVDDEVFVASADGSQRTNITNHPANDWGPDWSPDGSRIAFNSDREGGIAGWIARPDGSGLERLPFPGWVEYLNFSPDGTKVVYEGATGGTYDIFVGDLATGERTQLTTTRGSDSWPVWAPDGTTIAFSSERDDCAFVARDANECWMEGEDGEYHTIWLMDADGTNQRRVTTEYGHFVAWSPDGRFLLISGRALYVVRPDGTGRLELRAEGIGHALGGIPDWR